MSILQEIGLARKQRAFVVLEVGTATLKFPSATLDYVIPAGDAIMNQNPAFVNSVEKKNTLDIIDRFQNTMPAGDWSIPMYLRMPDVNYAVPQGAALFQAWQGALGSMATFTLDADYATADTLIHASGLTRYLPGVGVINVASNGGASDSQIHYGSLTRAEDSATCSFGDLTFDYAGSSTPATADTPNTITPLSPFYRQDTESPSITVWIETDHFVQGIAGASVNSTVLGVTNEGAVVLTFSGQGAEMVWAGESALATLATAGVGYITVPAGEGKRFSVGAFIYNETRTPATAASIGFEIESITLLGGVGGGDLITFATPLTGDNHNFAWVAPAGGWLGPGTTATGDIIRGYLPLTPTTIGTPIESRLTDIELDGVAAKLKGGDITFSYPKTYIEDEIGLDFPEDFLEDVRAITSSLSVYFRKANASYFTDGYNGEEVPVLFRFGNTQGDYMEVYLKRSALEVPTISFAAPAVELAIPLTAIGTYGEDSCDVVFT